MAWCSGVCSVMSMLVIFWWWWCCLSPSLSSGHGVCGGHRRSVRPVVKPIRRAPDVPVLMHIITSLGWESLAIFHDNSTDVADVVEGLVSRLHGAHILTSQEEGVGRVVAYQQLRSDFVPLYPRFLVLGSPAYVLDLFWQMSLVAQPNETCPFLFLTQWLTVLDQASLEWLQQIVHKFENLAVLVTSKTSDLTLWTLRHVGDDSKLTLVTSLTTPLRPLSHGDIFPNPLYGLGGRTLRVVVKELNIYSLIMKNVSGEMVYEGVSMDLLRELSLRANFTYVLFPSPPDGSFGQKLDNGQWDGPVGMLTRKEADLAVGYLALTSERKTVADATTPYYIENAAIVFRKESLEARPNYLTFFLHPFRTLVYVVIFVSLLLVLVLLVILELWRRLCGDEGGGRRGTAVMVPGPSSHLVLQLMVEDLEILVAGLLKQSFDASRLVSSAGHVLVMTWWLFGLVLTSVYSSQLTSSLTVVPRSLPFTSMAQLIQQDAYSWGVMGGTAMETMLKHTNIQVFQDYYRGVLNFAKTDPSVLSPDLEVHNARVLQGRYAHFVFFDSEIDKLLTQDCRVTKIPEPYFISPFVFYVQKGCPFTPLLSNHINRIVAAGLVKEWRRKRLPPNPACEQTEEHSSRVIGLTDSQTAFYMAVAGLLVASVILSLEHLYLTCSQKSFQCHKIPVQCRTTVQRNTFVEGKERNEDSNCDEDFVSERDGSWGQL